MNTFSCRFEFTHDYTLFVVTASKHNLVINTSELYHVRIDDRTYPLPDIHVEFMCEADLETVRNIMRTVADLHVGIQSLRQVPLKDNSLERDYVS
ncbi:hypothetical protein D3C85_15210 [compost metagenome]